MFLLTTILETHHQNVSRYFYFVFFCYSFTTISYFYKGRERRWWSSNKFFFLLPISFYKYWSFNKILIADNKHLPSINNSIRNVIVISHAIKPFISKLKKTRTWRCLVWSNRTWQNFVSYAFNKFLTITYQLAVKLSKRCVHLIQVWKTLKLWCGWNYLVRIMAR